MNKSQIIGWFLTIGTVLDTVWGVIAENAGLLSDFGVSPKVTKIIMALSILFTAFNKSLAIKKEDSKILAKGGGAGVPDKPL